MSNADRSIWQFPKNVANKVPGWRSDGKGLENKDWADPAQIAIDIAGKQDASANLDALAASAADGRDYLKAGAYVADDTALKALDITKEVGAFRQDHEIWWVPTADDISAEITAADARYIGTSGDATGASGGWIQAGSVGAGTPWVNIGGLIPAARIARVSDRLMVGDGAVGYNGKTLSQAAGSWMTDEHTAYLLVSANIAGVGSAYIDGSSPTTGSIGVFGAGRHNGAAAGGAIGVAGYALNDSGNLNAKAWGGYFEATREATGGFTHGVEIDITNRAVSPRGATAGQNPYDPFVQGSTHGLWIGCGGADDTGATLFNSDAAIGIINNGATHNVGIVFVDGGLTRDGGTATGRAHAIRLPDNHGIEQYEPATETLGATIVMNVSDAAHRQEFRIDDNGATLFNTSGKRLFRALWATSAVNSIETLAAAPAGTPVIRASSSDDTNVGIAVRPQGSSNGFLQGGGGGSQFRWSDGGFAFGGVAPVARPDWTAATGTATRTTFDTASVTLPQLAERVKAMIDDALANGTYA